MMFTMQGMGGIATLVVIAVVLVAPSTAAATGFVVNTLGDAAANGCATTAGGCTLRDAITDANQNGQPDEITFSVDGSIFLGSTLPIITSQLTISGPAPGVGAVAIRGNTMSSSAPILGVSPDTGVQVTIERLEIADARAAGFAGGGISKSGLGTLVLDSVKLSGNEANAGGGLFAGDGLTIVRNSTFERNHSNDAAGAIASVRISATATPDVELINSTVTDNSADTFGGAIDVASDGGMTILSSTIVGNTANEDGNISGNAGGIHRNASGSAVTIANSIIAGNTVNPGGPANDPQCLGSFVSLGHNLRSTADANCTGFAGPGDLVPVDPLLGALAFNGGPTKTHALLTDSPAIDAGDPAAPGGPVPACPTTDQRGLARGGEASTCDIGAFEVQPPPPDDPQPPPPSASPSTEFSFGKVIKNRRRGTAKLTLIVPGPGMLELAGSAKVRAASIRAEGPGEILMKIKPKGRTRTKLNEDGRAKVAARVTYTPDGGSANVQSKRVRLAKE